MSTVYGFCENNCRFPVYTQEQVLSILQQMIDNGGLGGIDPDESPVVALLREQHKAANISFWIGSEAEYNKISPKAVLVMGRLGADGTLYFCSDDTTLEGMRESIIESAQEVAAEAASALLVAKQDVITGTAGQFVGFNTQGKPVATQGVNSVNGKKGAVTLAAKDVGAATTATYTVTVPTNFAASGNHFYIDLSVPGILETDEPIADIEPGADNDANIVYSTNFGKVFRITTSDGSVRVWAKNPITSSFPMRLKVVR